MEFAIYYVWRYCIGESSRWMPCNKAKGRETEVLAQGLSPRYGRGIAPT